MRETLYRLFTAIAERVPAPEQDVIALNRWIGQSYTNIKLMQSSDRFAFGWPEGSADLSSVLWPIFNLRRTFSRRRDSIGSSAARA